MFLEVSKEVTRRFRRAGLWRYLMSRVNARIRAVLRLVMFSLYMDDILTISSCTSSVFTMLYVFPLFLFG